MQHKGITAVQKLDSFRHTLSSSICSMDYEVMGGNVKVPARFEGVELGDVSIFKYHGQPLHACSRKSEHILIDQQEDFLFAMPCRIPCEITRSQHDVVLKPRNLLLLSTREPFSVLYGISPNYVQLGYIVRIPGALLRKHVPNLGDCCGIPIAAHEGACSVMWSMVESLFYERDALSACQARMFGSILANAAGVATLNAPELEGTFRSRGELVHARTRMKAQAFIECNLSNPLLDAAMVAKHCHVSLRTLYAAFESASMTIGMLIRELRMQSCRNDLINPALHRQTISMIAAKWGYGSLASFTRSYREHFGTPPGEERRQVLVNRSS